MFVFSDWNDYSQFLEDSGKIRRACVEDKEAYFRRYNETVARRFTTLEANFHIWANCLSAIHPPQGTVVHLHVDQRYRYDYATHYRFEHTGVHVWAAGCVWHYLEPHNDPNPNARAILLFRGTAIKPATYRSQRGWLHTEPIGAYADGNISGVARQSYNRIRSKVSDWMRQKSDQRRPITFVGSSLGGSLAMRSLEVHRMNGHHQWQQSELYIFSSPGLETEIANNLETHFSRNQLHAFWHVDDWVAITGHYPQTRGREYSAHPHRRKLGIIERHTLPFVSLEEGWQRILAYSAESGTGRPSVTVDGQVFRSFFRQGPYGIFTATPVWVGMGLWSHGRTLFSVQDPAEWCRHGHH